MEKINYNDTMNKYVWIWWYHEYKQSFSTIKMLESLGKLLFESVSDNELVDETIVILKPMRLSLSIDSDAAFAPFVSS